MEKSEVAIVSGGGGGIGGLVSYRLAEAGYTVLVADASEEAANRVAESLPRERGQGHAVVVGDLTSVEVNKEVAERAAELGEITALVNAVGISPKSSGEKISFFETDSELWDRVMAINVKAPFLLTKEVYSRMPTNGSASIVNLLSITSRMGSGGLAGATFPPTLPSTAVYAASKAALLNLTISLARELAGFNIRVNGVAPGPVETQMAEDIPDKMSMSRDIPMGRFARPGEVVDAIEFLLSEQASYVNGASLDVNGGWTTG